MTNFNWDKSTIDNLTTSDLTKQILLDEANNIINKSDDDYKTLKEYNFHDFKKKYKSEMKSLEYFNILMEVAIECQNKIAKLDYVVTDYQLADLKPETLLGSAVCFYKFLGDKEFEETIYKYFITKQDHLRIQKKDDQVLTKSINGRCFYIPETNDIFISYYYSNKLMDIPIFIHETGHALSYLLYEEKKNPLMKYYLREFEAYFLEFLCAYYLGIEEKSENITNSLIIRILNDFIHAAYILEVQSYLNKFIFPPTLEKLNRKLAHEGIKNQLPNLQIVASRGPILLSNISTSILMAYDLFIKNKDDLERAVYEYKAILTSTDLNIYRLFKQYDITYLKDGCKNVKEVFEKALHL